MAESRRSSHWRAADAFAADAVERFGDELVEVRIFGSVVRDEADGDSDVDLLVVLRDDADAAAVEDELRAIAYDVELERAVPVSLVVKTESELATGLDRPFLRRVRREGEVLYG